MEKSLVKIENLSKSFYVKRKELIAVRGIDLEILRGETLGLVGESGCGKSTIGRTILRLYEPTKGKVFFDGIDLSLLSKEEMKKMRRRMQMIFQDPYGSLHPRMNVERILSEPLEIHQLMHKSLYKKRCIELLSFVGLHASHLHRYPHELSGGQRQRIGIARALAVEPEFLICDEPISSLDVSIQAQVVNLLRDVQKEMKLTYLFIAHDLAMVRYISDRVAVMYFGKVVELAPSRLLYADPAHPYTKALLASIPIPDPFVEKSRPRVIVKGEIPNALTPPKGCAFHSRCPIATDLCRQQEPLLQKIGQGHFVACHFAN